MVAICPQRQIHKNPKIYISPPLSLILLWKQLKISLGLNWTNISWHKKDNISIQGISHRTVQKSFEPLPLRHPRIMDCLFFFFYFFSHFTASCESTSIAYSNSLCSQSWLNVCLESNTYLIEVHVTILA